MKNPTRHQRHKKSLQRRRRNLKRNQSQLKFPLSVSDMKDLINTLNQLAAAVPALTQAMVNFGGLAKGMSYSTYGSGYPRQPRGRRMEAPGPDAAPDIMGYVYGYRGWNVHESVRDSGIIDPYQFDLTYFPMRTYTLASTGVTFRWYSKKQEAQCKYSFGDIDGHTAPDPDCSCGLYATFVVDHIPNVFQPNPLVGKVRAWGNIVEGSAGFRAQHMEIVSFHTVDGFVGLGKWGFDDRLAVKYLAEQYDVEVGVPISFLEELPVPWASEDRGLPDDAF